MASFTLGSLVFATTPVGAQQPGDPTPSALIIKPTGPVSVLVDGLAFAEGPAVTDDGTLYFTDIPNETIHRRSSDGALSALTTASRHTNGLWYVPPNRLYGCELDGAVVVYDLTTGKRTVLADQFEGQRFNACNDLVVDAIGGVYFTDPLFRAPTPLPQTMQAVYYLTSEGSVQRLTGDIAAPNGIGLSPDGKTLYVIPSHQAEMLAFDVAGPGTLGASRVLCRLKQPAGENATGGDGMTVDEQGNLYITTHLGIQIFSAEGQPRGLVSLPEQPANVTFGGDDFRTMICTARTSVYAVPMPIAGWRPPAK